MVKDYNLEDLEIWQDSRCLRNEFSELAKSLPQMERFKLMDQIIRASRSVSANIAEGYGRYHYQENVQFCRQARGSLYELVDHLSVMIDEQYITKEKYQFLKNKVDTLIKRMNAYINYLLDRKKNHKQENK